LAGQKSAEIHDSEPESMILWWVCHSPRLARRNTKGLFFRYRKQFLVSENSPSRMHLFGHRLTNQQFSQ